jgi:hypothetical protein
MKCKFCGNESVLVKAHIIPEGFFRRIQQGKEILRLVSNSPGEYTKRAPVGVYDKSIVCKKCEGIWQEWDSYAQKLLAEEPLNGRAIYHNNEKIAFRVDNFDYKKLKLFFISMVWRASISSNRFFSSVSLGKFEDIAKWHIENSDPGSSDDFSVNLAKFDHPLSKSTLNPHGDKISDVNYVRFYLADYIAYIKVDNKPAPTPFSKLAITENAPLYIICRDFTKSKELALMKKMVRALF